MFAKISSRFRTFGGTVEVLEVVYAFRKILANPVSMASQQEACEEAL